MTCLHRSGPSRYLPEAVLSHFQAKKRTRFAFLEQFLMKNALVFHFLSSNFCFKITQRVINFDFLSSLRYPGWLLKCFGPFPTQKTDPFLPDLDFSSQIPSQIPVKFPVIFFMPEFAISSVFWHQRPSTSVGPSKEGSLDLQVP